MAATDDAGGSAVIDLLGRLGAGDLRARDDLIACSSERLTRLARKMRRDFPGVARWEETGDVFNNAVLRLLRALSEVTPPTPADYFRLAAAMIRRELLDLARKYSGADGLGTNHASVAPGDAGSSGAGGFEPADETHAPDRLAVWTEFHRLVEELPAKERETFDLVYYQGMTRAEAAELIGVNERTVKRRWLAARLLLDRAMGGSTPGA